jgi:signal transduction histidine kinase
LVEPRLVRVSDTGVGFREGTGGLGTGLASLRERLRGRAELRLSEQEPHGVVAEVEFIP